MTDNPFATPTAPVQPPAREVPATTQPYAFIAVLALVTCLSFAVSLGIQWYNDIGEIRQRFSEHLQLMAPHWFTGLVFYAAPTCWCCMPTARSGSSSSSARWRCC